MNLKKVIRKGKNLGHLGLSVVANLVNGFPSKNLTIIGVTGTDGKTTSASLIYEILTEAGYKTAIISTVGAVIGEKKYGIGLHVTTPSPFTIQKYLRIAKKEKCTHAVIEVTSHAIDQNRIFGINFDIGVLTNITREHLDYHGSYENYLKTKTKLLKNAKVAIVNSNGAWFTSIQKEIPSEKLRTYSLNKSFIRDTTPENLPFKIKTKLMGDFNTENILAATLVGMELNVSGEIIDRAIQKFEAPEGRQQVINFSKNVKVIIDFAHTPNAFKEFLPVMRGITDGQLIHVFGCAGMRDKGKREEMGRLSAGSADIIVLTSEDPRGEKVSAINEMIKKGIGSKFYVKDPNDKFGNMAIYEIDDRKSAIEFALKNAVESDTVLITGKGHEKSMNLGSGEIPWSDEKVVRDFIATNHKVFGANK